MLLSIRSCQEGNVEVSLAGENCDGNECVLTDAVAKKTENSNHVFIAQVGTI